MILNLLLVGVEANESVLVLPKSHQTLRIGFRTGLASKLKARIIALKGEDKHRMCFLISLGDTPL